MSEILERLDLSITKIITVINSINFTILLSSAFLNFLIFWFGHVCYSLAEIYILDDNFFEQQSVSITVDKLARLLYIDPVIIALSVAIVSSAKQLKFRLLHTVIVVSFLLMFLFNVNSFLSGSSLTSTAIAIIFSALGAIVAGFINEIVIIRVTKLVDNLKIQD